MKLCLWAVILSRVLGIVLNTAEILLISFWPETAGAALLRGQIEIEGLPGGKAQIGVIFASGILLVFTLALYGLSAASFLRWQWKAYGNLPALLAGPAARPFVARHAALWGWFVPFANLVVPYWVARELWSTSDPDVGLGVPPPEAQLLSFVPARAPLVTTWWWLFLVMLAARIVAWYHSRQARDLGDWAMACWFELSASALTALAAWWAMRMIREITERQEERHANLRLAQRRSTAS